MKANFVVRFLALTLTLCLFSCGIYSHFAEKKRMKINQAKTIRNLGEAYMGQGEYTKALREFLKAESIYSDDPYLHEDLGIAYMAKGGLDKAVLHFKTALEINPDYSPARNNLGSAYIEQENWAAAIACFNKVKDDLLYGTPHYPLSNLGFVYYKTGDYDKAISYYEEALDFKEDFPKALQGLGLVYMAKGNYPEAIIYLQKALDVAPNQARIYLDIGKAYQLNQAYNKSYQAYKKAAVLSTDRRMKEEAEEKARQVLKIQ
ncbi:MAG: tetratricopeptide repeat protein [Dissulfuribacterales bacterium]